MLELLARLVDKSLVNADMQSSGARYTLLESIRDYGRARLQESGESEPVYRRHAQFFQSLTEQRDGEETAWLDRLERELGNLRAAMAWLVKHGEPDTLFELGATMSRLWYLRGYWSEGRQRLAELLALPAPSAKAQAMLLRRAGQLAWLQTDYAAARALLEQSLVLYRELGDTENLPASLNALGEVARTQGDYRTACRYYEESLAILRACGDKGNTAWALQALGEVAQEQGDTAARALVEESLTLFREVDDRRGISFALGDLGEMVEGEGDLPAARRLYDESLAIGREIGHKGGIARSLRHLGELSAHQGEYETAASLYQECLALRRELGDRRGIATCLERLAGVAARRGDERHRARNQSECGEAAGSGGDPAPCHEHAARLFGAAEALRESLGAPLAPSERGEYERLVRLVRDRLGAAGCAAAWAEGRAMSLEQAMNEAARLT